MTDTTVFDEVVKTIKFVSKAARTATITPESLLVEELSLDSLDLVAVLMKLQDDHGIEIDLDEIEHFRRVSDIVAMGTQVPRRKSA